MDILNKIIELLDSQNRQQKELTDFLGLEKSTFSAWKNGKSASYKKYLPEIANFFGISVDKLIGNERTTNEPKDKIKDRDIYRIQRMKQKATDKEWDKFMRIAEVSFDKYFSEDYEDNDKDE